MCQWDKDSCADAGFLKIDLLGLGMLSAVEECVDLIARHRGERIDLSRVPLDDPDVFAEIQQADTVGCFQIESRAQMQVILRTRPETIDDITVQVALVRPGPIQGKAVHPYVERRQKLRDDPTYRAPADHPLLEEPLRETLGVVVFQDQVLDVAVHLAGFTVGEAEGLRRAMSRKRSHAALEAWRERFVAGALEKGVGGGRRRTSSTTSSSPSRASASRSRTRPRSGCSRTSRRGCGTTTRRSSSPRSSTRSRWASIRRRRSSATGSGAGWRRARPT